VSRRDSLVMKGVPKAPLAMTSSSSLPATASLVSGEAIHRPPRHAAESGDTRRNRLRASDWTSDLPDELEGESVLAATSIRGNISFIIDVEKVTDEDCEDEDDASEGGPGEFPGTGECSEFCDPSTYQRGPMNFEMR